MQDIKEFNLAELESKLLTLGFNAYHARQIFSWVYKKGVLDFGRMSDLSSGLRDQLMLKFSILNSRIIKQFESKDGTKKILIELKDKSLVEAVNIPQQERVTGCVSTQVGCKFACAFCASGISGFRRNLATQEIIEEILWLKNSSKDLKLTHLVFMGTGEPLDNYENVIKTIRLINASWGLNIGARRITISTCGIIPGIKKLAQEDLQFELSVSLHASNNNLRSRLMPINKRYPLTELIAACKEYSDKTKRQVTFEYILIKGINSELKHANELVRLLSGFRLSKVNIIPSNSVKELNIQAPAREEILRFKKYLVEQGQIVTLRKERGNDIQAACGQLRLNYDTKQN